MVVVAIIGILAAVKLFAYYDHTKRSRVSEVALAASTHYLGLPLWELGTRIRANNCSCESSTPTSKYFKRIETDDNGEVTITAQSAGDAKIDDRTVDMTPMTSRNVAMAWPGSIGQQVYAWKCAPGTSNSLTAEFLPGSRRL